MTIYDELRKTKRKYWLCRLYHWITGSAFLLAGWGIISYLDKEDWVGLIISAALIIPLGLMWNSEGHDLDSYLIKIDYLHYRAYKETPE